MKEEGLENRWERCENLSKGVQNLFSDLDFLADESQRLATATAILYPKGIDDKMEIKISQAVSNPSNWRTRSFEGKNV